MRDSLPRKTFSRNIEDCINHLCLFFYVLASGLLKVLVNVSSQYAYLITCLCTLVQLVVSGLSTFPAVVSFSFVFFPLVDCMIVHCVVVLIAGPGLRPFIEHCSNHNCCPESQLKYPDQG